MQSFLSASAPPDRSGGHSNRTTPVQGAHHPMATNHASASQTSDRHAAKRLSSIQKLLLLAVSSFLALAYFFFMPSPSPTPLRPSSAVQRVDDHTPPPKQPEVDRVKAFFAMSAPIACPLNDVYGAVEIRRHNRQDDLWLVINGMVLNVTRFVPAHPGGLAILEGAAQDDAATLFSQFHSPSTLNLLSNFCIGRLGP